MELLELISVFRFFDDGHSDCYELILYCNFDLHFSNNWWCWVSFHVPFAHLYVFLERCLFKSSSHFWLGWCFDIELHVVLVFQSLSQLFVTPWTVAHPGFPVLHYLPVFAQSHVHQWGHPTISSSVTPFSSCPQFFPALGSFPVSSLFASGGQRIGASASVLPMYSELISFRIDWFDLTVQGTLKSLLQHHSLKVSILWHSDFFMVQLLYWYTTTGKTIALTLQQNDVSAFDVSPFSFLRIALAIWGLLYFHTNRKFFGSKSVKNSIGNLIGIALNL